MKEFLKVIGLLGLGLGCLIFEAVCDIEYHKQILRDVLQEQHHEQE